MRPLVKPTLVANDLARVERRPAPAGRLRRVAVETPPPEILGLFGSGVVCVLDEEPGVWLEAGKAVHARGRRTAVASL